MAAAAQRKMTKKAHAALVERETEYCRRREAGDRFIEERRQMFSDILSGEPVDLSAQVLIYLLDFASKSECADCGAVLPEPSRFVGDSCEACWRDRV